MKKIMTVAIASAMLVSGLSAFAGCGTEYATDVNWDVDLSKPIELSGLFPETGMGAFGKDDSAKIIEEKTGYKMVYQEMGANADSDVQNFLTTQAKFHIMKLTEAQYHPYLEEGAFLDLTDLLQNTPQGRTLYQLIDLMDYGWDSVKYTDEEGKDHIYAIPDFGFVCMVDSTLVWNMNHLDQIGFQEHFGKTIPETLSEVTWALEECQKKFGGENDAYHALGLPGNNSCEVSQIKGAFEVPWRFYVDENGKIMQYVFSDNTTKYVQYMNKLKKGDILSDAWQKESQASTSEKFAKELHSCTFISYWNMTPLVNQIVRTGQIATAMGLSREQNTYEYMRDNAIRWSMTIKGDGSDNSYDQTNLSSGMLEGDPGGVSYYTVIPKYMSDDALYVLDYLSKKIEIFADFYAGEEGRHWNKIEPAAFDTTAPAAEDYTPERDAEYAAHENLAQKIIFVRPYEYSYNRYSNKDPDAGIRLSEDESQVNVEKVTVKGGGYWCQLTERYITQIADNSQYCTGTNSVSAKSLFHLRETGFDAWQVSDPEGKNRISDPMFMCPPMNYWSHVSILCRTHLKNGIASAIDADDPVATIESTRQGAFKKSIKVGDTRYYYWSDEISNEMTEWYNRVRLPQLQK